MKNYLLFLIIFFQISIWNTSYSQFNTAGCLDGSIRLTPTQYKQPFTCSLLDLTQTERDELPIIHVRVNLHFKQNSAPGSPQFYYGLPTDWSSPFNLTHLAPAIVQEMNDKMSNLLDNPIAPIDFLGDSRIRFEIYSDPVAEPTDLNGGIWIDPSFPSSLPYGDMVLNLLVDGNATGAWNGWVANTFFGNNRVNLEFNTTTVAANPLLGSWTAGRVALHEFLHLATLCHVYNAAQPCASVDIDEVVECNNGTLTGPCGTSGSCMNWTSGSTNIMGNNNDYSSLTPCQWAQVYEKLHEYQPDYVWICEDDPSDILIGYGQTVLWDHLKLLNRNVVVQTGGQLTITCEVRFASGKGIYVEQAGRLIVDGGYLTNMCKYDMWEGVYVEGNATLAQPTVSGSLLPNKAGVVWTKNNAILKSAETAISTNPIKRPWPSSQNYTGALVVANATKFRNNSRAMEFMKYLLPETSSVTNCDFFEDNNQVPSSRGITIWNTNGLTVDYSRFYDLDVFGIYGIDFASKFHNGTTFSNIALTGIESYETAPYQATTRIGDLSTNPNYFDNIPTHVYVSSSSFGEGLNMENNEMYNSGYGISINGPSTYVINDNSLDNMRIGIQATNTHHGENYIKCNSLYQQWSAGLQFVGNNGQPSGGVQFLKNTFQQNWRDVEVRQQPSSFLPGSIRSNIGSSLNPAENCFTFGLMEHIKTIPTTTTFRYYTSTLNPCFDPSGSLTDGGTNNYYESYTGGIGLSRCGRPIKEGEGHEAMIAYFENVTDPETEEESLLREYMNNELLYAVEELYAENNLALARQLLEAEGSINSLRTVYGIYFKKGLYDKAEAYLNTLPSTSEDDNYFTATQIINLNLHRFGKESVNQEDSLTLENIVESMYPSSAYAQGILALVYGRNFAPRDYSDGEEYRKVNPEKTLTKSFHPNPTKDVSTLKFVSDVEYLTKFEVSSISGKIVRTIEFRVKKGENELNVDLSKVSSGVYFVREKEGIGLGIYKLIKI